jgi:peptidyl-Lys metalloendopeptidase
MAKKPSRASKPAKTRTSKSLLITLEFDKRAYAAADRQLLKFALTNESGKAVRILKWHTPLEGSKSDMFNVEIGGKRAIYMGRLDKRAAPREEDYLTLTAGETVSSEIDLTAEYNIVEAGNYNVRYRKRLLQHGFEPARTLMKQFSKAPNAPKATALSVKSGTGLFRLLETRPSRLVDGIEAEHAARMADQGLAKKGPAFSSCSTARQTILKNALAEAIKIATNARDALVNASHCGQVTGKRYAEWFGAYDAGRYSKVRDHFNKIVDALNNQDINFFCDCTEAGTYAYVYPTKPYEIHLCGAFWTAPLSGTDSQGGTIVHETSHFNVVARTDDHEYGQAACRTLAKDHPDDAIDNADSHEYSAENNPVLTSDGVPGPVNNIAANWRNMPAGFSGGFDAALNGAGPFQGKCYFFKGADYIRYDWAADKADGGYPRNIAANWPNMPAGFTSGFNAAVNGQGPFAGKCYFFKGDSYVRYDWGADRADAGYPKNIAANWHNLPAGFTDNFDACINGSGPFAGKLYIFKGASYIRYDWASDKTDPGYPRNIANNWHCLPASFTAAFDAALEGDKQFSDRGYFFKGGNYIRYYWVQDISK